MARWLHRSPECCEPANVIKWLPANTFSGPMAEGWAIITHVVCRSPEFVNIDFCPFCGTALDKQEPSKAV